jgi:hypothetical protein
MVFVFSLVRKPQGHLQEFTLNPSINDLAWSAAR